VAANRTANLQRVAFLIQQFLLFPEIAELDPRQQLSVAALVRVETGAIPHRLAGAGVVARIDCGRRSLGYVWLHDAIEAVRGWLFI
jgi:hypothetical protein